MRPISLSGNKKRIDKEEKGAYPQGPFAIRVEPQHHQGTAVECWSIERLPPSVDRSLEAEAGAGLRDTH